MENLPAIKLLGAHAPCQTPNFMHVLPDTNCEHQSTE